MYNQKPEKKIFCKTKKNKKNNKKNKKKINFNSLCSCNLYKYLKHFIPHYSWKTYLGPIFKAFSPKKSQSKDFSFSNLYASATLWKKLETFYELIFLQIMRTLILGHFWGPFGYKTSNKIFPLKIIEFTFKN